MQEDMLHKLYLVFFSQFSILTLLGPVAFLFGFAFYARRWWLEGAGQRSYSALFKRGLLHAMLGNVVAFVLWIALNIIYSILSAIVNAADWLNTIVPGLFH